MVVLSHCEGNFVDENQQEGGRCAVCEERLNIRHQIKELEEKLNKLKAKHHAFGTTMNEIHDPFIHKFPPEISSHIFRLCLPTVDCEIPKCNRWHWTRALTLGAVCRKWRQLAWATPVLWDTVFLDIHMSMSSSLAKYLPILLLEWLGRSGMLPLTILFDHDGYTNTDHSSLFQVSAVMDATRFILAVISIHSYRLRILRLNAGIDIFECLSGSMESHQLSNLDLTVHAYLDRRPTPVAAMLSLFERSGCFLKVLTLDLDGIPPPAKGLEDLLQVMLSLEQLCLVFNLKWWDEDTASLDDIFTRIFHTIPGNGAVSPEGATPKPFLPHLQVMDCRSYNNEPGALFSWDRIPQHYRQGHRRSLTLKSAAFKGHITNETALELLQLVDEGVDLQIVDGRDSDFLENFRIRACKQDV
jgi:hypothetical protein